MIRPLLLTVLLTAPFTATVLAQSGNKGFCLKSTEPAGLLQVCFPMTEQPQPRSPAKEAKLRVELERKAEAARARQSK